MELISLSGQSYSTFLHFKKYGSPKKNLNTIRFATLFRYGRVKTHSADMFLWQRAFGTCSIQCLNRLCLIKIFVCLILSTASCAIHFYYIITLMYCNRKKYNLFILICLFLCRNNMNLLIN